MNSYKPTARSRVKRLHERGHYDETTVHGILDAGFIAHIAYVIDGQPYVTPTAYWRVGKRLYWHGSSASRMLRAQGMGLPVCVTVTHLDGLVLARTPFHHSLNYRSVMAFGMAHLATDPEEKRQQLDLFVERLYPGRGPTLRPINAQELKATALVYMDIEEASAKIRTGQPKDDDEDYVLDCWAGVVPITETVGTPEPDPRLKPGTAYPEDLRAFVKGAQLDHILTESA